MESYVTYYVIDRESTPRRVIFKSYVPDEVRHVFNQWRFYRNVYLLSIISHGTQPSTPGTKGIA